MFILFQFSHYFFDLKKSIYFLIEMVIKKLFFINAGVITCDIIYV